MMKYLHIVTNPDIKQTAPYLALNINDFFKVDEQSQLLIDLPLFSVGLTVGDTADTTERDFEAGCNGKGNSGKTYANKARLWDP